MNNLSEREREIKTTPTTTITLDDVRKELKITGSISLNDTKVRELAKKPSGIISMADLRGKSTGPWYKDLVDYYVTCDTTIEDIILKHNGDLSNITIGFEDGYYFYGLFDGSDMITSTPKRIYSDTCDNVENMFSACNNLSTISSELFLYCPNITNFKDCFSLSGITSIPSGLFKNNKKAKIMNGTFMRTQITSIPEDLLINCPEVEDVSWMFAENDYLETIPESLFKNCPNISGFFYTFNSCYELKQIPEKLFINNRKANNFTETFSGIKANSIPENLFINNINVSSFEGCFYGSGISTIYRNLFINNTLATDFNSCFCGCNLTSIPQGLFDNCSSAINFNKCFSDCFSLISVPAGLFDKNIKATDFADCFNSCYNITSSLPDVWNKNKFPNVTDGSNYAYCCYDAANYDQIPPEFKGE